jgi:hypothetical protein
MLEGEFCRKHKFQLARQAESRPILTLEMKRNGFLYIGDQSIDTVCLCD